MCFYSTLYIHVSVVSLMYPFFCNKHIIIIIYIVNIHLYIYIYVFQFYMLFCYSAILIVLLTIRYTFISNILFP